MSRSKIIFEILWQHGATTSGAFEVDDVTPQVAAKLGESREEAAGRVRTLLGELGRMPDGKQFFAMEGNAAVPLAEYLKARDAGVSPDEAYPYEI